MTPMTEIDVDNMVAQVLPGLPESESQLHELRLDDVFYLKVFLIVFDIDCRRHRREAWRKGCGSHRIQKGNMEDIVDLTHGRGRG
jgi:hypothetical protein